MTEEDEREGARVMLLGAEANRQLFPGKPVIGEVLMVNGYQYTVIGVLAKKKQNGSYGSGPDNTQLFTTYSAMARDFPPPEQPRRCARVRQQYRDRACVSRSSRKGTSTRSTRIIAERHHYDPNDKEALWIWDTLTGCKVH